MKFLRYKTARYLYYLSRMVMVFYILFLGSNLFKSGIPSLGTGVKAYGIYNVNIIPKNTDIYANDQNEISNPLNHWFNDKLIIHPVPLKAFVQVRFQSYKELFSFPSILYQIAQLSYWLIIGFLIFFVQKIFKSFSNNIFFTAENASLIIFSSVCLILLPIIRWVTQELFIQCITNLGLNNSDYILQNGTHFFDTETIIGLVLLAFGAAFRAGDVLSRENESFI
ncbi:hypothetical protein [Sphingobacterium sp. UBA5996]|uniref:hypothetical protein n=1 Tax=Sphingobacterium sp. UBA5996 TaxID=1947505 RepID=UPI0025F7AA16|nr:hypothetical protein [Sphingobacterium sp. UBA5996]